MAACYRTWYRRAQRYKHHSRDGVFQADRAAEMRSDVTDDRRQNANDGDGDDETGPAAPVLSRRHQCKQELPEDGEEVHNVVKTGGQLLLSTALIIVHTWAGRGSAPRDMVNGAGWTPEWTTGLT